MKLNKTGIEEVKRGWEYDVLFGNGLANHLPMVLTALERMGADEKTMKDFSSLYSSKLEPLRDLSKEEFPGFEKSLGKRKYFPELLLFFKEKIEEEGIKYVLNIYLDKLFSGVSASAFHALIRLAYALEINSKEEVAISLAFWSSEYQYIGAISTSSKNNAYFIFDEFQKKFKNFVPALGNIAEKIADISKHPDFSIEQLQPEKIDINIIALLTIKLFLTSGDFILLHGVTSTHALRLVLPFTKNKESAMRYFWISLIATVLTSEFGEINEWRLPEGGMSEKNRINTVIRSILNSKDDHTIKIVYTCWQEFMHYGYHEYISGMEMAHMKII